MINNFMLRELRKDHFLTQYQIAKILKINRNTYNGYESQKSMIPINFLCDLALFYNVSVQYICGLTNYRKLYGNFKKYDEVKFLKNLKYLRKKYGYTQKEFGEKIFCSPNSISNYENGKRKTSLNILILISNFYKIPIDYILGIVE